MMLKYPLSYTGVDHRSKTRGSFSFNVIAHSREKQPPAVPTGRGPELARFLHLDDRWDGRQRSPSAKTVPVPAMLGVAATESVIRRCPAAVFPGVRPGTGSSRQPR